MTPRTQAARTLARVIGEGRSLDTALPAQAASAVRALCYETLRFGPRLDFFARRLLKTPPRSQDADVLALILIGLYELEYTDTPDYAVVDSAVEATRGLGKAWAVKLVNAVLRRFLREGEALRRVADADPEARHNHPAWLLDAFKADWPEDWQGIVTAGNRKAPLWLRVNTRRIAAEEYTRQLANAGLIGSTSEAIPEAICLERAVNVGELPGFSKGLVSVQDAGAQRAASLLQAQAGHRVLDACAAPGGKAAHVLERCPDLGELVALDISPRRLKTLRANLDRLGLAATVVQGDACLPDTWWDGRPFDRILVDAPCSGSGVIRRHPDIKWLKRAADIPALAHTQSALLEALWPLLAPGGQLLYATCSVLHRENTAQLQCFARQHEDADVRRFDNDWGRSCDFGRQILPGDGEMDGFYYALVGKSN